MLGNQQGGFSSPQPGPTDLSWLRYLPGCAPAHVLTVRWTALGAWKPSCRERDRSGRRAGHARGSGRLKRDRRHGDGRVSGQPSEIAAAVRMLVSDGGAFITGQVIHVNGGLYFG